MDSPPGERSKAAKAALKLSTCFFPELTRNFRFGMWHQDLASLQGRMVVKSSSADGSRGLVRVEGTLRETRFTFKK